MPPSTRLPNLPSVPKRSGSATDRTHAAAERRPAGAAGRPGAQTDRGHAAERQRPSGAAGRSGAQTDRGRYSQTLQPGTEEFYSFYLQRRKEEKPSESYGWSDADQNSVVRPWLDDKERRRARAQDSERKRADADKKMLLDLKHKSRKRNKEEAKSLMTELHRWIAGMTTRMEQNAGTKLSERSKFARRRDQMRLRQFVARLLEFTNVLAKGDIVQRSLLDQIRSFHQEVKQQRMRSVSGSRRREGLPPEPRLSSMLGLNAPKPKARASGRARKSSARSSFAESAILPWRPVYESEGISVGIRTYAQSKVKRLPDEPEMPVELLWKAQEMFLNAFQAPDPAG